MASSDITCEEEITRIPIKHTIEQVKGIAKSCGYNAALGVLALDAKTRAFVTSVAELLMQAIRLTTVAQAKLDP